MLTEKITKDTILTPSEHALINIIKMRSNYCCETLETIGNLMMRSGRTVQRTIDKLVFKSIIKKQYTTYKKIILTIK
jgi:predicted transcriptional regulator